MNSQKLEELRHKVQYYGRFTHHGGCLVFLFAIATFIIEFARLIHVSKYHKHDSSWIVEDDPHPDQNILQKMSQLITRDPENEKAIQMGNKESLIFVYYLNCAICILFVIIGMVMYYAAKPALKMVTYLQFGIEEVPQDL